MLHHFQFAFTPVEILWTLTFAAQLVLLVVLLGRERMARFPWFSTSIILIGLRLLIARLLVDRLPRLTFGAIMITLADVGVMVSALVLVEIARKVFRGARRASWMAATLVMLAVGGLVLRFWGAWPPWQTLTANSKLAALLFMQLAGQKGDLLIAVVTIQLGVLVALFGRSRGVGWHSHTQRIMIGLSTVALSQLGVQAFIELLARHVAPKTRPEYDHLLDLADRVANAEKAVFLLVLVWWIAALWKDEPGTPPARESKAEGAPPATELPNDSVDLAKDQPDANSATQES